MSQSADDDLWGDFSPAFEELLHNNVALAEKAAELARQTHPMIRSPSRVLPRENQNSFHTRMQSVSKENTLDVYRDLPQPSTPIASHMTPAQLREVSVNQQLEHAIDTAEKCTNITSKDTLSSKYPSTLADTLDTSATELQRTPIPDSEDQHHESHTRSNNTNEVERDEDDYMWMDFDVDFSALLQDINSQELIPSPYSKETSVNAYNSPGPPRNLTEATNSQTSAPTTHDNPPQFEIDHARVEFDLNKFGGFKTAGSNKSLSIKRETRQKVLTLFQDPDAPDDSSNNGCRSSVHDDRPHAKKPPASTAAQSTTIPILGGFTTGTGRPVDPISEESMRKAQQLLSEPAVEPPTATCSDSSLPPGSSTPIRGEKRISDGEEPPVEFKYENILSELGGFRMGSGKAGIPVSAEAKRQAVALFNASETTRDLTQSTQTQSPQSSPMRDPSGDASSLCVGSSSPLSKTSTETSYASVRMLCKSSPPRPTATPTASNVTDPSPYTTSSTDEVPKPPPSAARRRVHNQVGTRIGRVRPFKSPIIMEKLEDTRAAVNNQRKPTIRGKGPSVFSLKETGPRQRLCDLGAPQRYSIDTLERMDISKDIIHLSAATAQSYKFGNWGPDDAHAELIKAGALDKFLSKSWVENHYRWILWKTASLIRSYPQQFRERWSPKTIVEQLLYRYEREINLGHRSALKKILEHDDAPGRHIILVIAQITANETSTAIGSRKYHLLLTDGWYQVQAVADPRLEHAISSGRLAVGHKLSICGAQLANPQQVPSSLSTTTLIISSNGCQIAPWDAKLGYQKQRIRFRSLGTLNDHGGAVTAIDVIVCRKYPMMYRETLADKTVIIRNAREEEEARHKHMADAHLGEFMPSFREHPRALMSQHLDQHNDIRTATPSLGNTSTTEERNVSGHFKLLVCDYPRGSSSNIATTTRQRTSTMTATLLLLDANEVLHMDIREGHRYRVLFLSPYHPKKRRSELYLKTTRRTRWEPVPCKPDDAMIATSAYIPRHVTPCDSLPKAGPGSQADIAVIVLAVNSVERQSLPGGRIVYTQKLLATDESQALVQIKLRVPTRPLANIESQIIAFTDVSYDMHDPKYAVTHVKTLDESEIITKQSSSAPYIQQALSRICEWSTQNRDQIESLKRHVQTDILSNH